MRYDSLDLAICHFSKGGMRKKGKLGAAKRRAEFPLKGRGAAQKDHLAPRSGAFGDHLTHRGPLAQIVPDTTKNGGIWHSLHR